MKETPEWLIFLKKYWDYLLGIGLGFVFGLVTFPFSSVGDSALMIVLIYELNKNRKNKNGT